MSKIILAGILLMSYIRSECSEGCLRCSSDKKCLYCDQSSFFKLESGKCEKIFIENCESITNEGKCKNCLKGYYLEKNTFRCVLVKNNIENCYINENDDSCKECNEKYYVKNGKCEKVKNEIPHCLVYTNEDFCQKCSQNSLLSFDKKNCVLVTKSENCAFFSFFKCNDCKSNFLNDQNYFFEKIFNYDNSENLEKLTQLIIFLNEQKKINFDKNVCRQKKISNCQKFDNYLKCKKCDLNYFLTDEGTCEEFPFEEIPFCEIYLNRKICNKCQNGYFLELSDKCTQVKKIENCIYYKGDIDSTNCEECFEGYFIQNNFCVKREKSISIENCLLQNKNEDSCEQCKENFVLNQEKLKCLKKIENCFYNEISSDVVNCSKCQNNFFLKNNVCIKGSLENCEIYSTENICEKCLNSFYLNQDKNCVSQNKIENCSNYDYSQKDVCLECNFFTFLFKQRNSCKESNSIKNCYYYSDENVCSECEKNYYLENNECKIIPSNLNCLVFKNNKCEKCIENFYITNGVCKKMYSVFLEYCEKHNLTKTNDPIDFEGANCEVCAENAIGMNFLNNYICVENSDFEQLIPFCNNYTFDKKCEICQKGYFLENEKCVEKCDSYIFDEFEGNIEGFNFAKKNVCTQSNNCQELYINLENEKVDYVCGKCKEEFLHVIDFDSSKKIYKKNNLNKLESPIEEFSSVDCKKSAEMKIQNPVGNNTIIDNCEYYYSINENLFGCFKCKIGYSGVIIKNGENDIHAIEKCEKDLTCNTQMNLSGLTRNLKNILSCEQCVKENEIPFFAISSIDSDLISFKKLHQYAIVDKKYNLGQSGKSFFCANPNFEFFKISKSDQFNFPLNCGIGAVNVDIELDASDSNKKEGILSKMAIFCASCKPGYFAENHVKNSDIKIKCEKILFCKTSSWFNYCSECENNYGYEYTMDKGVLYDKCIEKEFDLNCFAIEIIENKKFCKICKKGYSRNLDGKCESFSVPKCKDNGYEFLKKFDIRDLRTYLYLEKERGCNNCEINFSALKMENAKYLCTPSTYLENKIFAPSSNVILNCLHFRNGSKNLCEKCKESFVVNNQKNICYLNNFLPFCEIAIDDKKCDVCINEFIGVNYQCEKKNLMNCQKYILNPAQNIQKCEKCISGFNLDNYQCEIGKISGCDIYQTNPNRCEKCKIGYFLINSANFSYCYPLRTNLNCEIVADSFLKSEIECQKCKPGFFLEVNKEIQNDCLPFNQIFNCLAYNKGKELLNSDFICKKCTSGYFVKDTQCVLRNYVSEHVLTYADDKDEADSCKKGYFIENGMCKINPSGKLGCTRYFNVNECEGCKPNYYLENKECKKIENAIPNCLYYTNETKCLKCDKNFLVDNDVCVQAEIQNCENFENPKSCLNCSIGFGLKLEDNIGVCEPIEKPNCLFYSKYFPWNCLLCISNFYPDENSNCSPVIEPIPNCKFYESEKECRYCEGKYVLSTDRKKCQIFDIYSLDVNCQDYEQLNEPICSFCEFGYFFQDDNCVKCVMEEGCLTCDPYKINHCLLCKPGFYQNEELKCIQIKIKEDQGIISFITKVNVILFLTLLFYF